MHCDNVDSNLDRLQSQLPFDIASTMQSQLYRTRIRECTAVKEAQAMRQSIFDYAPRSNASRDYSALVEEIRTTMEE